MHTLECDVAIIGASLAGAACAIRLQRSGIRTVLCDRAAFPRSKICGEGLSAMGIDECMDLFNPARFSELPQTPYFGFTFYDVRHGFKKEDFPICEDRPHGVGIQRYVLDQALIERYAELSGARTFLGQEPELLRADNGTYSITIGCERIAARYVVLATGSQSKLPQELGVTTQVRSRLRAGARLHYRLTQGAIPRNVSVFVFDHLQVCITPVGDQMLNVSCMISQSYAKELNESRLLAMVTPLLAHIGVTAVLEGKILTVSGIGVYLRSPVHDGIFVVGDALEQLDPIGGMGMTHGLIGARVLSETLIQLVSSAPVEHEEIC